MSEVKETPAKEFKISKELKEHILMNLATIRAWISTNAVLEASHVILEPIIKEYAPAHPEINLGGSCRECFIDMLRVCVKELKADESTVFKKAKSPFGYSVGDIAKTSTGKTGKVLELYNDGGVKVEGILDGKLLPKETTAA